MSKAKVHTMNGEVVIVEYNTIRGLSDHLDEFVIFMKDSSVSLIVKKSNFSHSVEYKGY